MAAVGLSAEAAVLAAAASDRLGPEVLVVRGPRGGATGGRPSPLPQLELPLSLSQLKLLAGPVVSELIRLRGRETHLVVVVVVLLLGTGVGAPNGWSLR
jgi:hypothetical protein